MQSLKCQDRVGKFLRALVHIHVVDWGFLAGVNGEKRPLETRVSLCNRLVVVDGRLRRKAGFAELCLTYPWKPGRFP